MELQATDGGSWIFTTWRTTRSRSASCRARLRQPAPRRSTSSSASRLHPASAPYLEGGQRIALWRPCPGRGRLPSGSRAGLPRRRLIGDTAGFLNVPKIKGTHTAMSPGSSAPRRSSSALTAEPPPPEVEAYPGGAKAELAVDRPGPVRNVRPSFHEGFGAASPIRHWILASSAAAPWTFKNHTRPLPAEAADVTPKIEYPRPDGTSASTSCPRCTFPTPTTKKTSRST